MTGGKEERPMNNQQDDDRNLIWEPVKTEYLVRDAWMDLRKMTYRLPDGKLLDTIYTYSRRDYVIIVPEDEEGNYLCVRQFRYGIGTVTTEFPAGCIEGAEGARYVSDANRGITMEDALATAQRELQEETGYASENWKHLMTIPSNATLADNFAYLFSARQCRHSGDRHLDDTEFLNTVKISPAELENLIRRGQFPQAMHVLAWLLAKQLS